jgi:hypothetical protein
MTRIASVAILAIATAWPSIMVTSAQAQVPPDLRNPQIEVNYVEPKNPAYRPIYERLKKRQVLEELRAFLAPLKLTKKLEIRTDECGNIHARYKDGGPATICYEYVATIEAAAPDDWLPIGGFKFVRQYAVAGAFVHEALYEVSLASFDILQIPVWGRDEYAADNAAGIIMLNFGRDVAYKTLMGTSWFLAQTSMSGAGPFGYARGADVDAQRFYNYLCLAYGADPALFGFVRPLLQRRAQNCSGEYESVRAAFLMTVMPHIDQGLLEKVKAQKWLLPDDGK